MRMTYWCSRSAWRHVFIHLNIFSIAYRIYAFHYHHKLVRFIFFSKSNLIPNIAMGHFTLWNKSFRDNQQSRKPPSSSAVPSICQWESFVIRLPLRIERGVHAGYRIVYPVMDPPVHRCQFRIGRLYPEAKYNRMFCGSTPGCNPTRWQSAMHLRSAI